MPEPVRVTVIVAGGAVQGIYGGPFVEVLVYDFDDERAEPGTGPRIWEPDPEAMLDAEVRAAWSGAPRIERYSKEASE